MVWQTGAQYFDELRASVPEHAHLTMVPFLHRMDLVRPPPPPPHEVTTLLKVDTYCTAPSLIPTANGNTVRSFPTHGQQSAAQASSTTVSRSDIR